MTDTNINGPLGVLGATMDNANDPTYGPSYFYQGVALLDPRYSATNKDGENVGRVPTFLMNPSFETTSVVPQAYGVAAIAVGANAVSGVAMVLRSVALGGTAAGVPSLAKVPMIPFGSNTPVVVLAQDFGFTTGTVVAASTTVTVPDSSVFKVGQWLVIGGAGNSGKTLPLICYVTALASGTTITINTASAASLTYAPIGNANIAGPFPANAVATAASPYFNAGVANVLSPGESLARAVSITSVSGSAGGDFKVVGYDLYGNLMHETITSAGGVATKFGQKAFKYLVSVTPQFSDAHAYSVGNSDTIGFALRSNIRENLQIWWNGGLITDNVGWLAASTTTPSAVTGDVRGTIQLSTDGNGTPITAASASDGVKRLQIRQYLGISGALNALPSNYTSLFGLAQF